MTVARGLIGNSLAWATASSLGTQALSFVTFAVLARLLGAEAFGLVALATLAIDLLLVVSTAGMSEAVIQRSTLEEEDADTAFWTNVVCGASFCLITFAAAPLVARLFGQPQLDPIIKALASIFAITPLGAIHNARLTRDLHFKSVALRNMVASLAGIAIGLPLAFAGYGVWALVWQRIAVALGLALSAWIGMPWVPRMRFRWQSCKQMLRFGASIGASTTFNQINIRAAEVISGALFGPIAVAFIRAGSRIVEVLNQITYMPFQQIAMPLLARTTKDRDQTQATYLRLSRLSAFIMFPAFFGCFALAEEIVGIIFGPNWASVADALRIFSCAVVASQMNNLIIAAITAAGASRTVLSWTVTQIALGITAAVAVSHWGWQAMLMTGVLRGYLVLPYAFCLLHRHVGIRFRDVLVSLRPGLVSAITMMIAVSLGAQVSREVLTGPTTIAIWMPVGLLTYFCLYILQDRSILTQMRNVSDTALHRFSSSRPTN
ncbi:lipopolysaccharide biosynthesis protein [Novosphingobium gossypii]|uniref:lipopolysaccharide biosynthesis protein n=1 Tax=Novosphingobium gossypii TaxID=1604774 RepID=UPI003D1DCEE0